MKSPQHPVPSGDRLIAQLYCQALTEGGHDVQLVSELRSWNGQGDRARQTAIEEAAQAEQRQLTKTWSMGSVPDLWFTYHVYHKAPDFLGAQLSKAFNIPYVVAEASHAPKQRHGLWQHGFCVAQSNIQHADLLLVQNPADVECLETLTGGRERIALLQPFIDTTFWQSRSEERATVATQLKLDSTRPWIATVAMMRDGDKSRSYQLVTQTLATLQDIDWQLVVIGDGTARAAIEQQLLTLGDQRVRVLGQCDRQTIRSVLAHSQVFFWPAINEALGMSLLEAQASGMPAVAGREGGVDRIIAHEETGLLVDSRDPEHFATALRRLLADRVVCDQFGTAARIKAHSRHSIQAAALEIDKLLCKLTRSTGH